jgi:hypothetical protein
MDLTARQRRYIELGILYFRTFIGALVGIFFINFWMAFDHEKRLTAEAIGVVIIAVLFLIPIYFYVYFRFIRKFQKALIENKIENRWLPLEIWSEEQKTKWTQTQTKSNS